LRDFVGDTGQPNAGVGGSTSPDVIVMNATVADPQAAFGAGSGTENSDALSDPVRAGTDNFVYVRLLNRGGGAAVNVTATVYWSPAATLITPSMWTRIGSTVV